MNERKHLFGILVFKADHQEEENESVEFTENIFSITCKKL